MPEGTKKTTDILFSTTGILAEILTQHFPNTFQKIHHFSQLSQSLSSKCSFTRPHGIYKALILHSSAFIKITEYKVIFNTKKFLHSSHSMQLSVLYGLQNKKRLFPYTKLTDLLLQSRRSVFTAQYEIVQVNLVIKIMWQHATHLAQHAPHTPFHDMLPRKSIINNDVISPNVLT